MELNYFHNNPAYRTMSVRTFVDDPTNYDLRAARNLKWEVRADVTYRGNRLSVDYFREDIKDAFRMAPRVFYYVYNRYDASAFDPDAAGRAPQLSDLPYEEDCRSSPPQCARMVGRSADAWVRCLCIHPVYRFARLNECDICFRCNKLKINYL